MTAHDYGLKCHISRPGTDRLATIASFEPDSMDSTTFARNGNMERMRNAIDQSTFDDVTA